MSAYLPESEARAIYGASPDVITGGVFAPTASARSATAQYRVSGRWRFASGCEHCDWLMGGCVVRDDGPPRARMVLFPAADAEIIDTWTVSGLRGTGSHDIAVRDLLVPATRSVSLTHDRPVASGALYAFPLFGLLAIGIAAVALGIARRALDEIVALAGAKTPTGGSHARSPSARPCRRSSPRPRRRSAAARAFLREVVGRRGRPLATRRDRRRAARAPAARRHPRHRRGGARGGRRVHGWRRHGGLRRQPAPARFRDVHVVTQHMMVAPATWELAGRVLLGLETDTTML